ncbi:MAG: ATP-grasp fold amidoligase family protein [Flavobacteriaceae bacterium]
MKSDSLQAMNIRKIKLGFLKKLKFLPAEIYVSIYYEYYTGKKLDLKNPVDFNQKIQWLKVYYRLPLLTQLVDKYSVRSYVKEKVGEKYLNELYAVSDNVWELKFKDLPKKFVIKGVHGCHFNLIVKDKSKLNKLKSRWLFFKWLHKNQYYRGGMEWAYKNVKPRLIAEKFLEETDKDVINDYKFFCFGGEPKFIEIDIDRGCNSQQRAFYDLQWNKLPFSKGLKPFEGEVQKPDTLQEMTEVVLKLAEGFPFVRVDLYSINNRVLFGEMTFYPADGRTDFYPEKYNEIFGSYITLPQAVK